MKQLIGLYKISRPFNALERCNCGDFGWLCCRTGEWLSVLAAAH